MAVPFPCEGGMATERLSMRQLREVLRQKLLLMWTHREVMASLGVGQGTVSKVLARAARRKHSVLRIRLFEV